ncbi:molecular chaperone Tir (plasmid) [Rhodococcus sp. p52]|uniref:TIR domain-containing protein n=1 Tax=unclassified Rhodococcus (in: high G+C Gram-positive bacteria) TaxID=192944 RepID=UPI00051C0DAB|nr:MULTISPECIES: TIR domain-containing protein [unclassified Rhodococcus (in: high G+C Gram-positive bacteria)]AOD24964.1 molecular chaperone Tir [Rhodococcus sp. p52]MCT7294091.1 TIR domain-containing protein [Rhodococcus sp. PAE-6]
MSRSSFVSFHYQRDHWRVQQVLRMGALDEQVELPAQDWEQVKRRGDKAVEEWIDKQMNYKQAVIVMIGAETASRKFVRYEIQRAWAIKKPLLGVCIHGLKNSAGITDQPGANPFAQFGFSDSSRTYADYVPVYDPADYTGRFAPTSNDIYAAIQKNIATWATQGYRRP